MPERYQDWMRQARLDLDHARLAAREGHLEWAVFAACKALHMSLGGEAWGHAIRTGSPRASRGTTIYAGKPTRL